MEAIKDLDINIIATSHGYILTKDIDKYRNIYKDMSKIDISDKNLEGKLAGAFGSYGWSGESIEVIQEYLNNTNIKVLNTSDIIKSTGM